MSRAQAKALSAHRRRLKRSGVQRVEVRVHKDDAALIRSIAHALSDPARKTEARALLRSRFGTPTAHDLKAYLASAPLEGIDLSRPKDMGRDVDI